MGNKKIREAWVALEKAMYANVDAQVELYRHLRELERYDCSDAVRDNLRTCGIVVQATPDKTSWYFSKKVLLENKDKGLVAKG